MLHPKKKEFIPEAQLWIGFSVPRNVTSSHRTAGVQKRQSPSTCAESQQKGCRLILEVRCNFKPNHESIQVYPTLGNLLLIWSWFQFIHFRRSPSLLNEMWLTNRQVQPRNLRCPRSKFQRAPLKVICFVVRTWEHADQFFLWKLFDWMIWGLDLWIKWVVSDVDLALGHVDSLSQKGDVALVIHLQEKQCIDSQDKTKTPITKTIFFDSWQFA